MIRTVLRLNPLDGEVEPVVEYFLRERVLERSAEIPGFYSAELHQPLEGGPLLVTATWQDVSAYQRWIDHPWRASSTSALSLLLDQDLQATTKGILYQLRHGVVSPLT